MTVDLGGYNHPQGGHDSPVSEVEAVQGDYAGESANHPPPSGHVTHPAGSEQDGTSHDAATVL